MTFKFAVPETGQIADDVLVQVYEEAKDDFGSPFLKLIQTTTTTELKRRIVALATEIDSLTEAKNKAQETLDALTTSTEYKNLAAA